MYIDTTATRVKRVETDGTAKKRGKWEEKRNGMERDGTDNKTEQDGNGAFFYAYCTYYDMGGML